MLKVPENCVWESLVGEHRHLSLGEHTARRYQPEVSPFAALRENTSECLQDLANIVQPGEIVLVRNDVRNYERQWQLEKTTETLQMVLPSNASVALQSDVRLLNERDVPAMLELTALTLPGYLRERSIEMGAFFGIFADDKLVAMTGERIFPAPCREITAVCTLPDYRGRGYATKLVEHVAARMRDSGITPFLHLRATNTTAKNVYTRLGFVDNGIGLTTGLRRL